MTKETKLGTSRTNVFRERTAEDIEGNLAFNWHYDRTLFGGLVKDIYLMEGKEVDDPKFNSFTYHDVERNQVVPILNDEDICVHMGMSMHVYTAGHFKASCHGVRIPAIPGLKRISQAYFVQPMPELRFEPPVADYQVPDVEEHDVGLVENVVGYKHNMWKDMTYADWNDRINNSYQALFNYQATLNK